MEPPEGPLISYRRDRNLCDMLVHGKLNKINRECGVAGVACDKKSCAVCKIMVKDSAVISLRDGKIYELRKQEICGAWNVIYGLLCQKCDGIVYVGETERTLYERAKEHMAYIRLKRDKPVSIHFNNGNHGLEDLKIVII